MKYLKPGKDNREERMNFVEYWAEYIRTHPDKDWSKQQAVLIDSQLQSGKQMTLAQYKAMKGDKF
jgi:hypothetical protein